MPPRSMRKGQQMGKTLENPSGGSFREDIVSERKIIRNVYSPIYSKYDWKYFIIGSRVLGPSRQ